jgi:hypothetical protein
VEIARAYRKLARAKGWLRPCGEKLRQDPTLEQIFAADGLEGLAFLRIAGNDRLRTEEPLPAAAAWTAQEMAAAAEHWRRDLHVDLASAVLTCDLTSCDRRGRPSPQEDAPLTVQRRLIAARRGEEGREWNVPGYDYFAGMFSQQTTSPPGTVTPLFPLVYRDCVELLTRPDDRIGPGDEKKVADHLLFAARPLWRLGEPLYWLRAAAKAIKIKPLPPRVQELGPRSFAITYRWNVEQPVAEDCRVSVQFVGKADERRERIVFRNDHAPTPPTSRWQAGIVDDGPYTVEVPASLTGRVEICIGLIESQQLLALGDSAARDFRYRVGTITATADGLRYRPSVPKPPAEFWSRGDGGWGEALCGADRLVKNTTEVLGVLNQLAADTPLASHEFLTADRLLQRTRLGELTITVSYGKPAKIGDNRIPAYGFIVKSPRFIAFCATRYNGLDYRSPSLFTARSLDGRPIAESLAVRIYHGFGDPRIRLYGKEFEVAREKVVRVR